MTSELADPAARCAATSSTTPTWRAAPAWLVLAAACHVVSLLLIVFERVRLSQDVALYLQAGREVLRGRRPLDDLVDINPPLVVYLSTGVAWLARSLGTAPGVTVLMLTWLAAAVSTLVTFDALRRAGASRWSSHGVTFVLSLFGLVVLMHGEFGQRDHWFVLTAVPYLVVRSADTQFGGAARAAIGLAAGLGACLKPEFALTVVLVELMRCASARTWRTVFRAEVFAVGATFALYGIDLIVRMARGSEYFDRWVPLIQSEYWDAYAGDLSAARVADDFRRYVAGRNPLWLLWEQFVVLAAVSIVWVVVLAWKRRASLLQLSFAIAATVATASFFVHRTTWWYQSIPMGAFSLIATVLCADGVTAGTWVPRYLPTVHRRRRYMTAASVGTVSILLLSAAVQQRPATWVGEEALVQIVASYSDPGDEVLVFDTGVYPMYPALLELDRAPGSRFLWHFPIALYSRAPDPPEERRFVEELAAELRQRRPALVLMNTITPCVGCAEGVSVPFYLRDRGLNPFELGYELLGVADRWIVFSLIETD